WATSSTRRNGTPVRWSVLVVSRALRIAGRWPSNSTSTTAPITWATRPVAMPAGRTALGAAFLAVAGAFVGAAFGTAALGAAVLAAVALAGALAAGFLAGVVAIVG